MIDVLLVDDDHELRRAVAEYLTNAGLRVRDADNVLRALRVLERERVHVIVTDDRMPGPAGLVLLETAKRRWPRAGRVLLAKTPLDAESRARALAAGAEVYLTRERREVFLAAILRLVHERQAGPTPRSRPR